MSASSPRLSTQPGRRATYNQILPRIITATLALIAVFTFAFSFTNVWALGNRLGVEPWAAPLVAPAVDLSVTGLLLAVHHLSVHGATARQLLPARLLLVFSGLATLALNAAEPILRRDYARAAFDAVGPLLLIGWSEVGPGLLRHLHTIQPPGQQSDPHCPASPTPTATNGSALNPGRQPAPRPTPSKPAIRRRSSPLPNDELLTRAREIDQQHRREQGRPVSADTLRVTLGVGSARARSLVASLRATHTHAS
ncbi:DUF2637 domain-containing protein [Actinomadura rudentiformis]|uniref:DUF2637 domain-containing protein n=1 Tax=Actinomadura rudentiformis TaxID=359158 RepID=A0A6H9YMJ8_9ACTN|nr:DUF2637 domain-containing protein [Actinomadura rudentiformis]KAB2347972.1 DUF2637 domain-containing protein [Actinomadura rudentiformis]